MAKVDMLGRGDLFVCLLDSLEVLSPISSQFPWENKRFSMLSVVLCYCSGECTYRLFRTL